MGLDLALKDRPRLAETLARVGRLPSELNRVTSLLDLYASTSPASWQFGAVDGLLKETKSCGELLEEQSRFSLNVRAVNTLSARMVTALGV